MTSLVLTSLGYVFSIILFFGSNSLFLFWILMELNLILFLTLGYILEWKEQEYFHCGLFYFFIQTLGSLFYLLCVFMEKMGFFLLFELILVFSMVIKVGLYPGSFWVFQMGSVLSFKSLYFLLVAQKLPLFVLFFSLSSSTILEVLLVSFFYGSLGIFFSENFRDLLICSSISSSFWVFILFSESTYLFLLFFFFYSTIFLLFIFGLEDLVWQGTAWVLVFMFLGGLPPFSLFFFKLEVVSFFLGVWGVWEFFLFWLLSFVCLIGYFKIFYKKFFFSEFLYFNNKFCFKKMFVSAGGLVFSLFFLL